MPDVTINLITRNYDFITPLIAGDVTPDGIDLRLDRTTPIHHFREDQSFQAGEMSFAQYLRRLADGDDEITGLPIYLMRGFRQRCFFVRRDSGLSGFADLTGKRIGTNGWPDTGNTWSRALLREAGVDLSSIEWVVGTIDGATDQIFGHQVTAPNLPPNASVAPEGSTLFDLMMSGELDAMMVPWPPRAFYEENGSVIRLFPDYRQAEQEYAARVGFFPAHHILGIRTSVIEEHPEVVRSLFDAFEESRKVSEDRRLMLADTAPWLLEELEAVARVLGPNWQAHGVETNRPMIAALADELYQQGIISTPVDPSTVFAKFEQLYAAQ